MADLKLPEGVAIVQPTRDAIVHILSNPRPLEVETFRVLGGLDIETYADTLLQLNSMIVTLHGEPVLLYYWNTAMDGHLFVGVLSTPKADPYPVFLTRCGKALVHDLRMAFPDRIILTPALPEGVNREWLKRIGFFEPDPPQFWDCPGGKLVWMYAQVPETTP